MRRILILEDNDTARGELIRYLNELPRDIEVSAFARADDAYACMLTKNVDIFIVDIILESGSFRDASGLRFIEEVRGISRYALSPVIVVTGLSEAKSYSFEKLHCYGYIEKPIKETEFKELLLEALDTPKVPPADKTMYYRKNGVIYAAKQSEIVYADCQNRSLKIHTVNSDVLEIPYISLKKFISDLDSTDFIQCSRFAVVNRNFVRKVDLPAKTIELKSGLGSIDIGIMYLKSLREGFT